MLLPRQPRRVQGTGPVQRAQTASVDIPRTNRRTGLDNFHGRMSWIPALFHGRMSWTAPRCPRSTTVLIAVVGTIRGKTAIRAVAAALAILAKSHWSVVEIAKQSPTTHGSTDEQNWRQDKPIAILHSAGTALFSFESWNQDAHAPTTSDVSRYSTNKLKHANETIPVDAIFSLLQHAGTTTAAVQNPTLSAQPTAFGLQVPSKLPLAPITIAALLLFPSSELKERTDCTHCVKSRGWPNSPGRGFSKFNYIATGKLCVFDVTYPDNPEIVS